MKWPWKSYEPPKNGMVIVATSAGNRDQLRRVFDNLDAILTRAETKLGERDSGKSS